MVSCLMFIMWFVVDINPVKMSLEVTQFQSCILNFYHLLFDKAGYWTWISGTKTIYFTTRPLQHNYKMKVIESGLRLVGKE